MTLVRIIKNWNWPDMLRQSPGGKGEWNGVQFTVEDARECDLVLVLNHVRTDQTIRCAPDAVWALIQEPPVPEYLWLRDGFEQFSRVYTPDVSLTSPRYYHSHGALPWHVNKTYDFLKTCPPPGKHRSLSSVTSDDASNLGKRLRLTFLQKLKTQIDFDLWGRGLKPIDDKWDGLAPYRYALAIENYSGPHYWTEKLADCFLAWTMPIYYGCTNIFDYFPKDSMIVIDINQPEEALEIIREAMSGQSWIRNREAIAHARSLVLDQYQVFPFISSQAQDLAFNTSRALVNLSGMLPPQAARKPGVKTLIQKIKNKVKRFVKP